MGRLVIQGLLCILNQIGLNQEVQSSGQAQAAGGDSFNYSENLERVTQQ